MLCRDILLCYFTFLFFSPYLPLLLPFRSLRNDFWLVLSFVFLFFRFSTTCARLSSLHFFPLQTLKALVNFHGPRLSFAKTKKKKRNLFLRKLCISLCFFSLLQLLIFPSPVSHLSSFGVAGKTKRAVALGRHINEAPNYNHRIGIFRENIKTHFSFWLRPLDIFWPITWLKKEKKNSKWMRAIRLSNRSSN